MYSKSGTDSQDTEDLAAGWNFVDMSKLGQFGKALHISPSISVFIFIEMRIYT